LGQFIDIQNQQFSFFGEQSKIKGDFDLHGPVTISAKLEGTINMTDKSKMIFENTGVFDGNINCHDIDIYGKFNGEIKSSGTVTIYPSAIVSGVIHSKNLVVLPGGLTNIEAHTI
jgi:cytoskeletal protein CcmA (bactofilin family)